MFGITRHTVFQGHVSLHFRDGRLVGTLEPGRHWLFGSGQIVLPVDVRPQRTTIGGQEVSSSDGGTFRISVVVTWKVVDAIRGYDSGDISRLDYRRDRGHAESAGLHSMVQVAIREWVMTRTFREAFDQRTEIAAAILPGVQQAASSLGLEITSIELLDLNVSGSLKAMLSEALKVEMEGEISLARARNEAATMRNLMNTARLVREHPKLLELRVLASGQKPRITFVVGGQDGAATGEVVAAED